MTRRAIGSTATPADRPRLFWRLGVAVGCLLLSGCLAQKADLNKVEQTLSERIQNLDKQEKEIDRLISETRARLSNEIHEMREEELPKFQGKLDETLYQLNALASRMDDRTAKLEKALSEQAAGRKADRERLQEELGKVTATITAMAKTMDGRLQEHDKAITASEALHKRTAQQFEAQNRALGALGDKVVQQDQRTDALTGRIEADAKTTSAHLTEVNKSIASIAKALEAVGGKFQTKVQEQDRLFEEMTKRVGLLQTEIAELTRAVHDLRSAKDPGASKKGSKHGKRTDEEAREPRVGQQQDQSPSGDGSTQVVGILTAPPSAEPPVTPVSEASAADPEARQVYDQSLQQFKQGDLEGALHGFSAFLVQHPASGLASNAQYWIGECYYGKKDFARAIEAYDRVQVSYPTSEKVPAALLKKAFAYLSMKDRKRASSALRQVVDAYPSSPEAGKASEKLTQLKLH
jgi:tol-pal system protein YbgF